MASEISGNMMTPAASSATSTSSGAAAFGGTLTVFRDSVGTRLTASAAISTIHTITAFWFAHQPGWPKCAVRTSGSRASSPAAGAGTPTKNSLAYRGCSVSSSSVLNRARRSTMHTAKISATTQPARLSCNCHAYSVNAGATPKDIASDSESSSAPILEVASSSRAIRPSRPSSTAATATAAIAP